MLSHHSRSRRKKKLIHAQWTSTTHWTGRWEFKIWRRSRTITGRCSHGSKARNPTTITVSGATSSTSTSKLNATSTQTVIDLVETHTFCIQFARQTILELFKKPKRNNVQGVWMPLLEKREKWVRNRPTSNRCPRDSFTNSSKWRAGSKSWICMQPMTTTMKKKVKMRMKIKSESQKSKNLTLTHQKGSKCVNPLNKFDTHTLLARSSQSK